jgi:anti-anti-sigma factor
VTTSTLAPRKFLTPRKCGMKVTVQSENGDLVLLRIEGRVSQKNVIADDPLVDSLGEDVYSRRLAIDLSEVATLDSSGVNWLLVSHKRVQEKGGKLVLHSLSPIANNVLKVLNLHTVFQVAEDESGAIQLLGGEA